VPRTAASEIHAKVVGREIRTTRHALGLTQAEVAERLGASASYISAVEAGRRNLTLGQLANIANAMRLGVNVSFIRPDGAPVHTHPTAAGLR
jgi:transcriptional regulator with XRE-family HTH domain